MESGIADRCSRRWRTKGTAAGCAGCASETSAVRSWVGVGAWNRSKLDVKKSDGLACVCPTASPAHGSKRCAQPKRKPAACGRHACLCAAKQPLGRAGRRCRSRCTFRGSSSIRGSGSIRRGFGWRGGRIRRGFGWRGGIVHLTGSPALVALGAVEFATVGRLAQIAVTGRPNFQAITLVRIFFADAIAAVGTATIGLGRAHACGAIAHRAEGTVRLVFALRWWCGDQVGMGWAGQGAEKRQQHAPAQRCGNTGNGRSRTARSHGLAYHAISVGFRGLRTRQSIAAMRRKSIAAMHRRLHTNKVPASMRTRTVWCASGEARAAMPRARRARSAVGCGAMPWQAARDREAHAAENRARSGWRQSRARCDGTHRRSRPAARLAGAAPAPAAWRLDRRP